MYLDLNSSKTIGARSWKNSKKRQRLSLWASKLPESLGRLKAILSSAVHQSCTRELKNDVSVWKYTEIMQWTLMNVMESWNSYVGRCYSWFFWCDVFYCKRQSTKLGHTITFCDGMRYTQLGWNCTVGNPTARCYCYPKSSAIGPMQVENQDAVRSSWPPG